VAQDNKTKSNDSPPLNLKQARSVNLLGKVQLYTFALLLIFTPLAKGATPRWAFCITLWLLLVSSSAMLLRPLWQQERLIPKSPIDLAVYLLLSLALGSFVTSINRSASSWAFLRLLLYLGVFYLTLDFARSRHQTKRLVFTIMGLGTSLAFIGFIKYQGGSIPAFWDYGTSGGNTFLTSTFVNHNHIAGYLVMVFALGLGLFFFRPFWPPAVWVAVLILILVAICLSMSRGGWVATFCSLEFIVVFFLLKKGMGRFRVLAVASVLFVAVGLTILGSNPVIERLQSMGNENEPSLVARLAVWKASLKLIEEKPLLGTGPGTFPWSFTRVRPAGLTARYREAHNDYVQVATEMGLLALIPICWGLFSVFRKGLSQFKNTNSRFRAGLILGSLGGIIAILVHSVSDFNMQITANGILFSLLVGLAVGTSVGVHTDSPKSSSPQIPSPGGGRGGQGGG
jgi:O-antigen ligase